VALPNPLRPGSAADPRQARRGPSGARRSPTGQQRPRLPSAAAGPQPGRVRLAPAPVPL
jgi:hypothetical protein